MAYAMAESLVPAPEAEVAGTNGMAVAGIKDSLKERGVRLTRQRQILLDLIDKSGQHLDAERLYLMAKEKDPKLNRVTVYRTLKMLKAGGLVDELDSDAHRRRPALLRNPPEAGARAHHLPALRQG